MDYNFNGRILQNGQPIGGGSATYEKDLKNDLQTTFVSPDANIYAKLSVIGNCLYFVISGLLTPTSTPQNFQILMNVAIDIPQSIASKIYRADGTTLDENPTGTTQYEQTICGASGIWNDSNRQVICFDLRSEEAYKITSNISNVTFTANNKGLIDLRTFLTIL